MSDFAVRTSAAYVAEKRGWLRGPHGTEPGANPSITLDFSLFTAEDHYPDGYIPSGTVVTAEGGPAAVEGTDAYGLLFNSETVTDPAGKGVNAVVIHGFVDPSRLPLADDVAGGAPEAVRNVLSHIVWG